MSNDKPEELPDCLIQERYAPDIRGGSTTFAQPQCKGDEIGIVLYGGVITQVVCPYVTWERATIKIESEIDGPSYHRQLCKKVPGKSFHRTMQDQSLGLTAKEAVENLEGNLRAMKNSGGSKTPNDAEHVRDIVWLFLKNNGYDGLYNDGNCGCTIEDLVPCCGFCADCEPGYLCEAPEGHDESPFWIGPKQ